jgi:hypothetical protein
MDTHQLGRLLLLLAVVLGAVGLLLYTGKLPGFLGRLPGDIRIERDHFRIYLPISTSLLISVVLSLLLYAVSRLR